MTDVTNDELNRLLYKAVVGCDVVTVRGLLEAGAAPDFVDGFGSSALFAATVNGDVEVMKALLDAGANPNLTGETGSIGSNYSTPLHFACANGISGAITLLLERGADPSVTSQNGLRTAAHHMFDNHRTKTALPDDMANAVLKRMFELGLSPDVLDFSKLTLLRSALVAGMPASTFSVMLEHGADPKVMTQGDQVIHAAIARGRVDVVRVLVDSGVDVNSRDADGRSALFYARDIESLGTLLELGADITLIANDGQNVFHFFTAEAPVDESVAQTLMFLLDQGADVHQIDNTGQSAFDRLEAQASIRNTTASSLRAAILAREARDVMRNKVQSHLKPH